MGRCRTQTQAPGTTLAPANLLPDFLSWQAGDPQSSRVLQAPGTRLCHCKLLSPQSRIPRWVVSLQAPGTTLHLAQFPLRFRRTGWSQPVVTKITSRTDRVQWDSSRSSRIFSQVNSTSHTGPRNEIVQLQAHPPNRGSLDGLYKSYRPPERDLPMRSPSIYKT